MTTWSQWRGHWEDGDADEKVREVFAHYGAAAYFGQVLEIALVNFLFTKLLDEGRGELTRSNLDGFYEGGRKLPLGRLVKRIKDEGHELPAGLLDNLWEAVDRRNYLAHYFFFERAADFMDEVGRQGMITFLEGERSYLSVVNEQVNSVITERLASNGSQKAAVEEASEALIRDYRAHPGT